MPKSYPDFLKPNAVVLKGILHQMLTEDLGDGDITTIITPNKNIRAEILAEDTGNVSGIYELNVLFGLYGIQVLKSLRDGDRLKKGRRIFLIQGNSKKILVVERTALNILSRMSGITTRTRKYVNLVKSVDPSVRVAATRKTTPLFRYFEKKAVVVGGGVSHRMGLFDMLLLKDNHIKLLGNVKDAVKKAKKTKYEGEVEVTSLREAIEAAETGAKILMLDNLLPDQVKKIVNELRNRGLRDRVMLEASGRVTHKNIKRYASTGIDIISVGCLTHSVPIIDASLRIL